MSDKDKISKLACELTESMTEAQRQTLGILLLSTGSDGVNILEKTVKLVLQDDLDKFKDMLSEFDDCEKCKGTGKLNNKTCPLCKGSKKMDKLFPAASVALNADIKIVEMLVKGTGNPLDFDKYLPEALISELRILRHDFDE